MPPKAKFTKEQIISKGLDIVREEGMDNLTARALGNRLGSSACPIFTVFENMEEVQTAVKKAVKDIYAQYVSIGLEQSPAFKGVGMQYILFAMKEPRFFQLLFMSEEKDKPDFLNVLSIIEDSFDKILLSVKTSYALDDADALRLYRHLWIYTHGIASLCANKTCNFEIEEIESMLSEVFIPMLKDIKGGKA